MWLFSIRTLLLVTAAATAHADGSYWVVYEGDAPTSCVVEDGLQVNDTCCTDFAQPFFIRDFFAATCFVIPGLLDDGGKLQAYYGCDNNNVPIYGEGCYEFGIIPNGTIVEDYNATDIADCGCTFEVTGQGCHKVRDFSSLPGFEADTRQVFVYLDDTCKDVDDDGEMLPGDGDDGDGDMSPGDETSFADRPVVALAFLVASVAMLAVL